jgi:hypothetical protein
VGRLINERASASDAPLTDGQRRALGACARRYAEANDGAPRGVIIADEVGMGKTRVAVAVARAVKDAGGRVGILVPPGLQFQWRWELSTAGVEVPALVHTLGTFLHGVDAAVWQVAPVLLVSQNFSRWQMRDKPGSPRWGFLALLVANHLKARDDRYPRFYREWLQQHNMQAVDARAKAVLEGVQAAGWKEPLKRLDQLVAALGGWRSALCDPEAYAVGQPNREWLERAVGWGLGRFDLIVIDEAHKAPGEDTVLSRLLDRVIHPSESPAWLALTATPVSLHVSDWSRTLGRVGLRDAQQHAVQAAISTYSEATDTLRGRWRTDPGARDRWISAALGFHAALTPYVIRRGKGEEEAVRRFAHAAGDLEYRIHHPTLLSPAELSPAWRDVVFAAEGLSAATLGTDDQSGKRLRLTLANGHGVAETIAEADEAVKDPLGGRASPRSESETKRAARAAFWRGVIRVGARDGGAPEESLYRHPHILRAVHLIEARVQTEKFLVFGRFTAPMRALQDLLNSRAKLRNVRDEAPVPWPAESLGLGEPGPDGAPTPIAAVDRVAAAQLGILPADFQALVAAHAQRLHTFEARHKWLSRNVRRLLGLALKANLIGPGLGALTQAAIADTSTAGGDAALARALRELLPDDARQTVLNERATPELLNAIAEAFRALVEASTDQDRLDGADEPDEHTAGVTWGAVRDTIAEEFSPRRGGFARRLDGDVRQKTRRLLQAAFNRQHSYPRVLIAQSVVGREGLNLHEACRIVLLLHPEWNPGVVEQQIGRVDRLGSQWAKALERALAEGVPADKLPRIEVHSILFGGTYDEHHWGVLMQRWRDLRAQLHGVVIPPGEVGDEPTHREIADGLNRKAPNFAP